MRLSRSSWLYYFLGLCSLPALLLLVRAAVRARYTKHEQTYALPTAPISERRPARARRAGSSVRLAPTADPMEFQQLAGYDLLAGSAGPGDRFRPSCSSLTASQAATLLRRIQVAQLRVFSNSWPLGGRDAGIHSTQP